MVTKNGPDPRRRRWEVILLATMYAGYAAMMLCRNTLIASSAAVIQDPTAGIDKAAYGRLMSWHSAGAIAGKLSAGVFADRFGGRRTFLLCLFVTALSTIAFGMVSGFLLFAALNFLGQFFKAGGWPASAKLIGEWYAPRKHGSVWSILSTSSRVGTMAAVFGLASLLAYMSWRGVFVVAGIIALLIVGGAWFLLKDRPQDVGLEPPEQEASDSEDAGVHALDGTTLGQACLEFVRSPRVWLICFAMAFLTILMDFLNFIPIYLTESMGLDPAQAGRAGSFFPAGMFVALLVSSVWYGRIDKRRLVLVQGGLLTLACASAAFLWLLPSLELPQTPDFVLSIAAIFLFGFAISPAYYLPMSIFSIAFGGPHSGFLIALIDVFGYAGALLFNFFGGSIAQEYGWPVFLGGLLTVAVMALFTLLAFLRLDWRADEHRAARPV